MIRYKLLGCHLYKNVCLDNWQPRTNSVVSYILVCTFLHIRSIEKYTWLVKNLCLMFCWYNRFEVLWMFLIKSDMLAYFHHIIGENFHFLLNKYFCGSCHKSNKHKIKFCWSVASKGQNKTYCLLCFSKITVLELSVNQNLKKGDIVNTLCINWLYGLCYYFFNVIIYYTNVQNRKY